MGKLTKYFLPTIFVGIITVMVVCVLLVISGVKNYLREEKDYNYTIEDVFNNDVLPVIKTQSDSIVKPYIYEDVKVGKGYYDYESDEKKQESSIIYFENTYMQNSGVDYVSDKEFDVVSILDGEIISIEDNDIYGKILKIKHNDNLISVYSNIKDILYKVGDKISQSEIIANTDKSKLDDNIKSMLHFEIYYKGETIDPEKLYTMKVSDFE